MRFEREKLRLVETCRWNNAYRRSHGISPFAVNLNSSDIDLCVIAPRVNIVCIFLSSRFEKVSCRVATPRADCSASRKKFPIRFQIEWLSRLKIGSRIYIIYFLSHLFLILLQRRGFAVYYRDVVSRGIKRRDKIAKKIEVHTANRFEMSCAV